MLYAASGLEEEFSQKLFDKLIEECKEKKYSGLVWQVPDWNEPAINFYKKYPGVVIDKGWLNCYINF
jgi:ribosomal protein S18 acetylase RimI-like enzyme